MNWEEDISEETRNEFIEMGYYSPTLNPGRKELKGSAYDFHNDCMDKDYLTSDDLRKRAAACIEAADWLDKRAKQ